MYAGSFRYSGVVMLVNQNMNPLLAYNDPKGRWMVVQCLLNGEVYEFAGIYAYIASLQRVMLWKDLMSYPWLQNSFMVGDFNNALTPTDNTSTHSHMLATERTS